MKKCSSSIWPAFAQLCSQIRANLTQYLFRHNYIATTGSCFEINLRASRCVRVVRLLLDFSSETYAEHFKHMHVIKRRKEAPIRTKNIDWFINQRDEFWRWKSQNTIIAINAFFARILSTKRRYNNTTASYRFEVWAGIDEINFQRNWRGVCFVQCQGDIFRWKKFVVFSTSAEYTTR